MTTQRTESRFGTVGKTVGGILVAVAGLVGAWGWIYLLAVSVQGPGGLSGVSMPFFTVGLLLWVVFWGAALGIAAVFFGRKSRLVLVGLVLTGLMLAAAIIVPVVASVL